MTGIPSAGRMLLRRPPTDMRKSFSGLVGLVEQELGRQVEAGGLFLFFSRRRNASGCTKKVKARSPSISTTGIEVR